MKDHYDPWYVRMPDGRVIKAKSSQSVRYHVEAGHIPRNSMLRRLKNEEWVSLGWLNEFADLVGGDKKPEQITSDTNVEFVRAITGQGDPMRLETVGVRGLTEELLTAFDSTGHRDKLIVGSLLCGLSSVLLVLVPFIWFQLGNKETTWLPYVGNAISALLMTLGITWISRQTHWELSRMRSISLGEAQRRSFGPWIQLILAYTVVIGILGGLIYVLNHVPIWLAVDPSSYKGASIGLGLLIAKIFVFQLLLLVPVLGPIGPIEEYNFIESIGTWQKLCARNYGRILVYEGVALVMGFLAALPILLPYNLAGGTIGTFPPNINPVSVFGTHFLMGLAIGPMFVFLIVSNVILYLNLRYEFSANR
ncbi:hypothetical protein KIH39_01065 [Telmatocola sphagniphila]|uniref:Uncharacterized protein n=1 Tax=Telmatocola sphagniphila TaxID=1123043 RepID=A0A8E6B8M1_9BACT|nr:hypothetical protein [Telmatocola sphagniphila]QVL32538.1 hypothetical protein KIH39_01065 [Telmatocola sphagniphila]